MASHESDEEINKDEENVSPLRELVMLLTDKHRHTILEILFEHQFSMTELVPITSFNPRSIINSMMTLHEDCMTMFHKDHNSLKKLVYKYNSGEKVEEYIFSNNMTLYADIITICYLHHVLNVRKFTQCKLVHRLMKLMKNKYIIQTYEETSLDPRMLTLHRIALSYPSISFDMAYDKDSLNFYFFSEAFSHWNVPNVFCSPWLALIIPVLNSDYKTPLALLLAMAVTLDTHNKPCYLLYQRVLALYTSEVFSKYFKLELCEKWGIVYKTENEYNFAPYFTTARQGAIIVISSLKENDPSLQYVLSKI